MPSTASGVTIPGYDPLTTPATPIQELWNNLGKSLNGHIIVPVASVTARAALVVALKAEGFVPSAAQPLYVNRADANLGMNLEVTRDGVTWYPLAVMTPNTVYTPALTASGSNPSLGAAGAIDTGEYSQVGRLTEGFFTWQFGAGMAAGSGTYYMSLPVPAAVSTTIPIIGTAWLFTGTWQPAILLLASATTVQFRTTGATPSVAHNVPTAWAEANSIRAEFRYTAA